MDAIAAKSQQNESHLIAAISKGERRLKYCLLNRHEVRTELK
jgi:hypothetical protein